jgi:hypothetical protein
MSALMWIRSHVERLLQDQWDACRVEPDSDGDYPFRKDTAAGWVSVLHSEPPMVRVYAHAAHGIRPSAKLFREINDINNRTLSAQVTWLKSGGVVLVSQTVSAVDLTRPVLAQAVDAVGVVANDIGPLMAGMFGGVTPYPVEVNPDAAAA